MFMIQPRKSFIFRTVFLIIMIEFTFVEKSFSNQNTCGFWNTRSISYFKLHSQDVNWTEAWRQCNNNGSTLPVICNQHEQDGFTKYLERNARDSSAWTSGRKIPFNDWKWINGQSLSSTSVIPVRDPRYTRAHFNRANKYLADDPLRPHHYLCHYSNTTGSCMHGIVVQVTNGCVRPSRPNDQRLWYDARNQCVGYGGDLAIIVDDKDVVTLMHSRMLNATRNYWIGLEKNYSWRWMLHKTEQADDVGEDVKFTNWTNSEPHPSRECISIDASNGGWKAVNCDRRISVICQTSFGSDETTSRTSSSETTSRPTSSSETPITENTRMTSIYLGLGAGIAILIICIIVIIFVVKYKRKPHKNIDQSKVMNSSKLNGPQLSPNKPATSPANASAIAPVAGTDDTLGVYAEITAAPLNSSEDEAQLQQPGVLYAALEFQKEPTYLEPNHKNAQASVQTKAGPMGDIYAIPDAKGRTGNEPASHPLLVTSQGDVYALPLKNSMSPTSNSPVGGIYANL